MAGAGLPNAGETGGGVPSLEPTTRIRSDFQAIRVEHARNLRLLTS